MHFFFKKRDAIRTVAGKHPFDVCVDELRRFLTFSFVPWVLRVAPGILLI